MKELCNTLLVATMLSMMPLANSDATPQPCPTQDIANAWLAQYVPPIPRETVVTAVTVASAGRFLYWAYSKMYRDYQFKSWGMGVSITYHNVITAEDTTLTTGGNIPRGTADWSGCTQASNLSNSQLIVGDILGQISQMTY